MNSARSRQEADLQRIFGRGCLACVISATPSSRRYDRVTKLRFYQELGVHEYWLVDPETRTLERLVLRDGVYVITAALVESEVLRPETFEDPEIPLARLWQAAE